MSKEFCLRQAGVRGQIGICIDQADRDAALNHNVRNRIIVENLIDQSCGRVSISTY